MEPEWLQELREILDAEGPEAVLRGLEQVISEQYSKKLEDFTVGDVEVSLYNDTSDGLRILARLWEGYAARPKPEVEFRTQVELVNCPMCGGDGVRKSVDKVGADETCEVCGGSGKVDK